MALKVGDVSKVKRVENVMDLIDNPGAAELLPNYVVTPEVNRNLISILETVNDRQVIESERGLVQAPNDRPRSPIHMLIGSFGTGKTYFLLMLAALADGKGKVRDEFLTKIPDYPILSEQMRLLGNSRFLVVKIRLTDFTAKPLAQVLLEQLAEAMLQELNEVPAGFYRNGFALAIDAVNKNRDNATFLRAITDVTASDADRLVSALNKSDLHALDQMRRVFQRAFGAPGDFAAFPSLRDAIVEANSLLKTKNFRGIVFCLDEFSQYVTTRYENGMVASDVATLQNLYEISKPIHSVYCVMASHFPPQQRLPDEKIRQEFQRVRDRYEEHGLSETDVKRIAEDIIQVDSARLGEEIKSASSNWRSLRDGGISRYHVDLFKTYPMHPATIHHLFFLAGVIASKNRTSIQFVVREISDSKVRERPIQANSRIWTVTPDRLFEYFAKDIQQGHPEWYAAFQESSEACKEDLDLKVLMVLFILRLATRGVRPELGEAVDFHPSAADLAWMLNEAAPKIAVSLEKLTTTPYVSFEENFEVRRYWFEHGGVRSIQKDRLEKIKSEIDPQDALDRILTDYTSDLLRDDESRDTSIAKRITVSLDTERTFELTYTHFSDFLQHGLRDVEALSAGGSIAKSHCVVVLPTISLVEGATRLEFQFEDALKVARQVAQELRSNYVILIPRDISALDAELIHTAREAIAIKDYQQEVFGKDDIVQACEKQWQLCGKILRRGLFHGLLATSNLYAVSAAIDKPYGDAIWKEHIVGLFPELPLLELKKPLGNRSSIARLERELFNQRKQSVQQTSGSVLLDYCETILKPLGLCKIEGNKREKKITVVLPSSDSPDTNARKTGGAIATILDYASEKRPPSGLYAKLRAPPYGMSDQMIELLFGVLFHQERIGIFEGYEVLGIYQQRTSIGKMSDVTKDMDRGFQIGPHIIEQGPPQPKPVDQPAGPIAPAPTAPTTQTSLPKTSSPQDTGRELNTHRLDGEVIYDALMRQFPVLGEVISRSDFCQWWNQKFPGVPA